MNRKKRIESLLLKNFSHWKISVLDNSFEHMGHNNFDGKKETHFQIFLTSATKDSVNKLDIHRKINHLLKEEYTNGLHALEINII